MRIAWVLYGSLEERTGGTIYDAAVVAGLRRAGDDAVVVSLERGDRDRDRDVAGELRALGAEVVVGDELCFRELAVAFEALEGGGPRRVLLVHHLTAWETELGAAERDVVRAEEQRAIDACDAIVATSRVTRERLVAEGAGGVGIEVVVPGADRMKTRGSEGGGGAGFVFVGSVIPRKRVLELVRAFAGGAHERARLVIVGSTTRDAGYVSEVRAAIAELGVGERVEMRGEVDEDGVARALAEADALVMPSTLEGYGIAATEAIYAGVPVIAARAQGLEEALARCAEATMFVDDEAELAESLARFAKDAPLREAMRKAAREAAGRMPTWAGCAEGFRAALGRVAVG
jgi:glycosyltransferase involved in cell wall biosynthesis